MNIVFFRWFAIITALFLFGCSKPEPVQTLTLQLNWLHDPTFAGEYLVSKQSGVALRIREGGPNIFPLAELQSGAANVAVVGADIFLQALAKDYKERGTSDLVCIFVDFQRNPVGWVLHPDAARRADLDSAGTADGQALNKAFFGKVTAGILQVGDKRGTETTSIWIQWKRIHQIPDSVNVVPVGFDTSIVLGAPMLAYPVYLNEEPYKLSEKIGKPVLVLDPVDDGISLYGNVLVTTRNYLNSQPDAIKAFQTALRAAWENARTNPSGAANEVVQYYKGVSSAVLNQQINKTLEFVFFGGSMAGTMDLSASGKWHQTLRALDEAGILVHKLDLPIVIKHVSPPS